MNKLPKGKRLENSLERTIKNLKEKHDMDAEIKISVYDISDGLSANVDGDKIGWAASIIKVPIMVTVLEEIEKEKLSLDTRLRIDHKFTLEKDDYVSELRDKSLISVMRLMYHMIVESDNEATNMLANKVGIDKVNKSAWNLGLDKTMLGHLIYPGAPRTFNDFNPAGSNLTCTDDMVTLLRHIYDEPFSKLSPKVRKLSNVYLTFTDPILINRGKFKNRRIKSKTGFISHPVNGEDIHETGIIDDHLIVSVMLNKVNQNKRKDLLKGVSSYIKLLTDPGLVYSKLMGSISRYVE